MLLLFQDHEYENSNAKINQEKKVDDSIENLLVFF